MTTWQTNRSLNHAEMKRHIYAIIGNIYVCKLSIVAVYNIKLYTSFHCTLFLP